MTRHTFQSVTTWLTQFSNDEGPRYALLRDNFRGYHYRILRRHSPSLRFTRLDRVMEWVENANRPRNEVAS